MGDDKFISELKGDNKNCNKVNYNYKCTSDHVLPAVKADCLRLELKSFDETNQVFKCLQLTVPSGSIFGLIGPSGCGKTTFFRTILGRYSVFSGSLTVLGIDLTKSSKFSQLGSEIGYMPQDIALDQDLTVTETLHFYGCLHNLPSKVILEQSNQLKTILGFDHYERKVCQLSIGQQRRLSLACALLHRPKLALLDEPTVGSDPLLVKRIWDYLKSAKGKENMTIIVSTHYLDEVRKADFFAFLARGYVLFQDNPSEFIRKSGLSSLEEAIASMYKAKIDNKMTRSIVQQTCSPDQLSSKSIKQMNSFPKINQNYNQGFFHLYIWLLWRYKHRWMKHMIYRLIGVGFVHAMIITFCGLLYGHFPKDMAIGLINHDNSSSSLKYIELLKENQNNWTFPYYTDERIAREDVESGRLQGYLSIGSTFTSNLDQLIKMGLSEGIDNVLLADGFITLTQDTVNRLKADSVELTVFVYLYRLFKKLVVPNDDGSMDNAYLSNLQYVSVEPLFQYDDRLKDLAPNSIILIKFFFQLIETVTVGMIVLWVTREFHDPTVERLSASGVTRLHLSCALMTITTILMSPIILGSCVILTITTGFPVHGSWIFVATLIPAIVIAGCAKAIWIGSIIPSTTFAILVTTSYGFIGIFTGSIFWPLEGLPYFMVPVRNIYPYTESGLSAVRAMIYGDSIWSPQVYGGLIYAWSQACITSFLLIVYFTVLNSS